MISNDIKALYGRSKKWAMRRQRRLKKLLLNSSIDPNSYVGLFDCTPNKCGRETCIVGCAYGDRRRRIKQLPKVHELLAGASDSVFEIRLTRSSWARRFEELDTASILAAKQMTRRALDKLYIPTLIAVGTFKVSVADFQGRKCIWVCSVHLLVSGVDEQSALESVFGGGWQQVEEPSELRVCPVVDLAKAIKSVFTARFEWWADPIASSNSRKRRFEAIQYGWLFSQKADERVIRYGCDRHFNPLKKKPRVFKAKAPPRKRPYPWWLEPYMFGSGLLDDFMLGSKMSGRRFKRRNPLMAEIHSHDQAGPTVDASENVILLDDLVGRRKKRRR